MSPRPRADPAAAHDVLAAGAESLERLEAALRRAHYLTEAQRAAVSTHLVPVCTRLRAGLAELRRSIGTTADGGSQYKGSGG